MKNTRIFIRGLTPVFTILSLLMNTISDSNAQLAQKIEGPAPEEPGPAFFYRNTVRPVPLADSVSIPQVQYYYTWEEPGEWVLRIYATYKYQDNMLLDTNLNYYQEGGDPFNRVIYNYDMEGRNIGIIVQRYEAGFVNTSWFEYDYDEYDNRTLDYYHIWFSNEWKIATGSRSTYVYNAGPSLTEISRESYNILQGWSNDEKTEIVLNEENEATEIIYWDWVSFSWQKQSRLHQILWKEYDGEHASGKYLQYQEDLFTNDTWEPLLRRSYTYYQMENYEYVEQSYRGNETWENELKYAYSFNEDGLAVEWKGWKWEQGEWEQKEGMKYTYIREGIDLTEVITQQWDTLSSTYVNIERTVFDAFLHFQSTPDLEGDARDVVVYPNPCDDILYIKVSGTKADRVLLYDQLGRLVLNVSQHESNYEINTRFLEPGIYILKVIKDQQLIATKKIVKS